MLNQVQISQFIDVLKSTGWARIAILIALGRSGMRSFPQTYSMDRFLEALVSDVRRHGRDIAGLHRHTCAGRAGVLVSDGDPYDRPELDEPFDAIIAMKHRGNVFLRRRTGREALHTAVTDGSGNVRTAEIPEQAERATALRSRVR